MEKMEKMENQHSSAVAFVEGGTQDACEDNCSICLEPFCNSDPSTVTSCNHDFHLQCILEWCQRSSQCPMCWQPICMKDSTSQMLLEVVEKERIVRGNRFRQPVYRHSALPGSEFEQLEASVESVDLSEMERLAATAITDMAYEFAGRERVSNSNRLMNSGSFSAPVSPENAVATSSRATTGEVGQQVPPPQLNPSNPAPVQTSSSLSIGASGNNIGGSNNRNSSGRPTSGSNETSNETASPSELQGFSESFKSRLNAASSRYRESIRKNTRGWKERLFSRNVTLSDLGSEVKKEVSNGIANVSRMMQRLEAKDNSYVNEVGRNKNSADGLPNTNPNPSIRLHLSRVAASDSSSSSTFLSNASSSNARVASSSSK